MSDEPTLRQRRERLGITQGGVAALAGVAQSQVCRAEYGRGPDSVRAAVAEALWTEERRREGILIDKHAARLRQLEAAWVAVPESPEKDALKATMIGRARELLDEMRCEEADAILEFLPQDDVKPLLDAWYAENFPDE